MMKNSDFYNMLDAATEAYDKVLSTPNCLYLDYLNNLYNWKVDATNKELEQIVQKNWVSRKLLSDFHIPMYEKAYWFVMQENGKA